MTTDTHMGAPSCRPFEVRPLTIEDLELEPPCFANAQDGYARMGKAAHYAQFAVEGHRSPLYWFRNITPEGQRWAGITEFGATPLSYQIGIHGDDIAQEGDATHPYGEASPAEAGPDASGRAFELLTPEPYSLLRFEEDGGGIIAHAMEGEDGSILDITIEPFPYAVISHAHAAQPAPYFQVNTLVRGTFHGQPIVGLGGFDRTFVRNQGAADSVQTEQDYAATYRCTCALYSGVREDGRKECVYALITTENGHGIGIYYIDGEEPVVTDEVRLDAVFQPLPYVDDGTVVYTDATWHIGPKTIHFTGKWGTKSFSFAPKLGKHGQSQCFGTWYEGDVPYQHVVSHAFNENTGDAYAERFREMGFTVLHE